MITIAVCDDEKTVTGQIETFLYDISQRENIPVDIDVFYSGHDLEQQISGGKSYDLIYLDIQMEGGDGISTAEQIRKTEYKIPCIDIMYFESRGRKIIIHLKENGADSFNGKLSEVEKHNPVCRRNRSSSPAIWAL